MGKSFDAINWKIRIAYGICGRGLNECVHPLNVHVFPCQSQFSNDALLRCQYYTSRVEDTYYANCAYWT